MLKNRKNSSIKILNLYAGIGGNRFLWDSVDFNFEITAVENDPEIAKIYENNFPNDKMIVDDAHDFLIKNYKNYDIIWTSPPCQTHSLIRYNSGVKSKKNFPPKYIDLTLYQEIVFLEKHFFGKYVVENVRPYYKPLIQPTQKIGSHYFWANFYLPKIKIKAQLHTHGNISELEKRKSFSLKNHKIPYNKKRQILRNAIPPELGLHILNSALQFKLKDTQEYFDFDASNHCRKTKKILLT